MGLSYNVLCHIAYVYYMSFLNPKVLEFREKMLKTFMSELSKIHFKFIFNPNIMW